MKNTDQLKKHLLSATAIIACLLMHSCTNNTGKTADGAAVSGSSDFADSALSTVSIGKDAQGREVIRKNNTFYDIVDYSDAKDKKKIILKMTKVESGFVDSDNLQSHFIVSGMTVGDSKATWKKEFPGSDLSYANQVIVLRSESHQPNEEDTYTQYSLLTGEKLMTYTYAPLLVTMPGTARFIGYLSKQSSADEKPEGHATVSYVGRNGVIDKINIKVKGNNTSIPTYTPELKMRVAAESGNTLTDDEKTVIMGRLKKDFAATDVNKFALLITYQPTTGGSPVTILLPVRDDRLDIANAQFDGAIFELSKAGK